MSAIQLLGASLQAGHGRDFTYDQLAEIGETLQAQHYQLIEAQARHDALARILAVVVTQVGGNIEMTAAAYEAGSEIGVEVSWSEDEDTIYAQTYEVQVPPVRGEEEGDGGEGDAGDAPVPSAGGTGEEVAPSRNEEG